jgi:hypothetical protein
VDEYGEWLDDWLREAYKQLYGADPLADAEPDADDLDSGDADARDVDDEWLTEDVAEAALEHINNDCAYPTWRDVGMALANHFGESVGGRLFEQWSRGASKWDRDAKRQAERIVSDASNYQYDAGTLVYHAQEHGWDASAAAREHISKRSDGGTAAVAPDDSGGPEGPDGGREWSLNPLDVLELAVRDPLHPLDYDDNGAYDGFPRDLRGNERANYVWTLAKKVGADDVLAQRHGPILAFDDERCIWRNDDQERLRDIAKQALGSSFSAGVVSELEANVRSGADGKVKDPDELGAPDKTIMTKAGLLHLRDRELEPGKREHYAQACIPTKPDWSADCPRWREFVAESIDTEEERLKFQEYCGYTLWRHAQTFGKAMLGAWRRQRCQRIPPEPHRDAVGQGATRWQHCQHPRGGDALGSIRRGGVQGTDRRRGEGHGRIQGRKEIRLRGDTKVHVRHE